jgi:hypothetical protein
MAEQKMPAEFEEMLDKELSKLFESAAVKTQEYAPIETDSSTGTTLSAMYKKAKKGENPLENPNLGVQEKMQLKNHIQWLLQGLAMAHKVGDDKRARKTRNQLRRLGWYVNTHGKELPPEVPTAVIMDYEISKVSGISKGSVAAEYIQQMQGKQNQFQSQLMNPPTAQED